MYIPLPLSLCVLGHQPPSELLFLTRTGQPAQAVEQSNHISPTGTAKLTAFEDTDLDENDAMLPPRTRK